MKILKTITPLGLFIAALLFLNISANAQDKVISESELPAKTTTYLKSHFPNHPIVQASIDKYPSSHSYDVMLRDRISLEFDSEGAVTKIESKVELPGSVIPKEITEYVRATYPDRTIVEWKLDNKHQEVELDNGLDLEFDMKGKFIRIDD